MRKKITLLFADVLLLGCCYLAMILCKQETATHYLSRYTLPFAGFVLIRMFTSWCTDKYTIYARKKIKDQVVAITIADFAAIGIGMLLIYFFKLNLPSRIIVLGTIFSAYLLEIIFSIVLIVKGGYLQEEENSAAALKEKKSDLNFFPDDQYELAAAHETPPAVPLLTGDYKTTGRLSFSDKLQQKYLASYEGLYDFIARWVPMEKVTRTNTMVMHSHLLYNIEQCDENSQFLFINLHKINDIRRINRFFIRVNINLKQHGYYVSCMQTRTMRKEEIFSMFPPVLNGIVYLADFLVHRICPKLPVTKQIYFALTKGANRSISKAEAFGRLYACGFEVVAEQVICHRLFFIARKIKKPLMGNEPTYGVLVRLPRIGKDGRIIKVYKLRTMHPFSEYLQEYVYQKNRLDETGKFHNDFRITEWGRILRKIWLDEVPMIINILKGEMKWVGVRPISQQYMSLYSPAHQELRKKVKPGLFPPYYADLPKTFEEIEASEARYINRYLRHPFRTDVAYFFKILYNIIFKKARSR